jgi:CRISPR-associated exonuclease Cas4
VVELIVPRPICSVIKCDDVNNIDLKSALKELEREHDVHEILPGIYAYKYDFNRISPSLINDYSFCPRLLWIQQRLGLKLLTERLLVALVRGRILHQRYERAVTVYDNVIAEYRVEIGNLVGVIDVVVRRGREYVPVELKTGAAGRDAHRRQLQAYIQLLGASRGYLVYRDRVEIVREERSALALLAEIEQVVRMERPPDVTCRGCAFISVCRQLSGPRLSPAPRRTLGPSGERPSM